MPKTLGQASIFIWTSQDCCSHYKPYHQNQPCGHASYSEHLAMMIQSNFIVPKYILFISCEILQTRDRSAEAHSSMARLIPYMMTYKKSHKIHGKVKKAPAAFLLMNWNSHCSISLAISTALLSIQGNPKRHSSADFIAKDSQTMFLTLISQIL